MANPVADRVWETATTTGTGTFSLGGAKASYRAFSGAFSSGNTVHYCIVLQGGSEWEVGLGTLTSGSPWTLARTAVLASSNGNAAVDFSAGTKDVFHVVPASVLALIQTAVQSSRALNNGDGITGGGDLSADRTLAINAAPSTIASASTTDLASVSTLSVVISGTTTITSFGTGASRLRFGSFSGALTLTHNATSLKLPGGANIATAAGDRFVAMSDASGNWTVLSYVKADGTSVDANALRSNATKTLSVGFDTTSYSNGTISSGTLTPSLANGNVQHYTNNGAHTLAPPSGTGSVVIDVTNGASAGVITTSGFTKTTGDTRTSTNGHKFRLFITVGNGGSHIHTQALQ